MKNSKRLFALLTAAVLTVSLTACSGGEEPSSTADAADDKQPSCINVQLHDSRKNDATENQFGDVKAVIPELLEQQVLLFLA